MTKVFLLNGASNVAGCNEIHHLEIIPMSMNENHNLLLIHEDDNYKIYRKERITFLEDKIEEIQISMEEFDKMRANLTSDSIDDALIKTTYVLSDKMKYIVYENKFEGLVTLEKDYKDDLEFANDQTVNGIDITELEIANDKMLLNMTRKEFELQIAQIRINYNVF
ncbi:MAG: hypothetical protein MJ246_08340 [Clostridia bacterium]|nr:hypothetical protein [Clostridia bacterium]